MEVAIKIVLHLILIAIIAMFVVKYFRVKTELKLLRMSTTFSNDVARKPYLELLNYLKTRKSKLSVASKIEILKLWSTVLLYLPRDMKHNLEETTKSVDFDKSTITPAEHKKAIIDALNVLAEEKGDLPSQEFDAVVYHLYYLLFK